MSAERVVKWNGLPIWWPRSPRVLAKAVWRIDQLQNAIQWALHELDGSRRYAEKLQANNRHLENLLEARWNANDARFSPTSCDCGQLDCTVGRSQDQHSGDARG